MSDKAIKVAVLEGNFASLCGSQQASFLADYINFSNTRIQPPRKARTLLVTTSNFLSFYMRMSEIQLA